MNAQSMNLRNAFSVTLKIFKASFLIRNLLSGFRSLKSANAIAKFR